MINIDNIHDLIQNDVTSAYLEAYARKDLEERYCRGARDFRLVHTTTPTDMHSYYILVFKYKLYPNRDVLYIYKYDTKTDRLEFGEYRAELTKYMNNFSLQSFSLKEDKSNE